MNDTDELKEKDTFTARELSGVRMELEEKQANLLQLNAMLLDYQNKDVEVHKRIKEAISSAHEAKLSRDVVGYHVLA